MNEGMGVTPPSPATTSPPVDPTRPYEPTGMTTARWQTIPPEPVNPHDLTLAQHGVTIHGLLTHTHTAHHPSHSGDPYPHAVHHNGQLHLADGHHRIALALIRGDQTTPVRVLRR